MLRPRAVVGRIVVDFAGSREEAKAFAKEHGFQVAKPNKSYSNSEMPSLTVAFSNESDLHTKQQKLEKLGWDQESQIIHLPPSSSKNYYHQAS